MCVWNVVGFYFALKISDIACSCDYGVSFGSEGFNELILVTVKPSLCSNSNFKLPDMEHAEYIHQSHARRQ